MTKPNLHLVQSPEDALRELIPELDAAKSRVVQLELQIADIGPLFIRDKYPNAREFVKPSIERLRGELGHV